MMKTIYNIMVYLLAVCLFSCQQDDINSLNGMGYLRLAVSESQEVNTRAAYNPEQLHVEILDENKKVVEKTDDYTEWKGTILELPAGKYTIKAYSNAYDGERGFDKAYYYGSQTATVESGKEVSTKVTCKLANVKVSVRYDEAFLKAFEGREIAVEVGSVEVNSGIAPLSFTTTEKRSAYFPETDLYAKISINNPEDPLNPYTLEQKLEGVKVRDHYILNYKLADKGSSNISVTVDPTHKEYSYTFEVNMQESALTADFVPANAWAKFAYLEASNVQSSKDELVSANVIFKYRKKGDNDWNDLSTTHQDGEYTATLTQLEGKTEYEYCLADGENMTPVQTFTTEETVVLPNGNLDSWYKSGKTWYAVSENDYNASGSFWDSSNPGTTTGAGALVNKNPTQGNATTVHTSGGQSAELKSQYASAFGIGKFAAASLYTGKFNSLVGTNGAKIDFGQPFVSRPTALHGWFHYNSGKIDYRGNNTPEGLGEKGSDDLCSIYIALSKKQKQVNNTDTSTFLDLENDTDIIAYGRLDDTEAVTTNGWKEFTLNFKYKTLEPLDTYYLIIVFSASKYGDYFTGSTSSVMYVDDLELIYGDEPVLSE